MGQPAYSITSVLFSLLTSAGLGSLAFQRIFKEGTEKKWLIGILSVIAFFLLIEVFITPYILNSLLGLSMAQRFMISAITIAPLGFSLGMPFPLAIRVVGKRFPEAIPWAWGLNAYMTVVGSILCVLFAITVGFRMNFLIALGVYCTGFLFFYRMLRREGY